MGRSYNHRLKSHESEQTARDSGGRRSLVCCSPWGCKESEMTQQLNSKGLDGEVMGTESN